MTIGPNAIGLAEAGALLIELGTDLAEGHELDALTAARRLSAIFVAMIPVDQLKAFLRPEDRAMADLAADVAEDVKIDAAADAAEASKLAK